MFVELIRRLDSALFYFVNGLQHPWLDQVLGWPTVFGNTQPMTLMTTLVLLTVDKTRALRRVPVAMAAVLTSNAASSFLKTVFLRQRPYVDLDHVKLLFGMPHAYSYSFPSGHATVAFCAATMLHCFYGRRGAWAYVFAVWVCLTRMYVGVHYPTDLLGGALLGFLWARLYLFVFSKIIRIPPPDRPNTPAA